MRRAAYISILIGLWLFGMATLMIGLDDLLFRGHLLGWFLFGGGYWAALCSVALAEEVAEWRATRDYRPNCPLGRRGSGGWGRVFRHCSEAVAQRQLPGS